MLSSSEGSGGGEGVISAGGSEEGFNGQYQENDGDKDRTKKVEDRNRDGDGSGDAEEGEDGDGNGEEEEVEEEEEEENDHEELSVLPRHTKVVVTGNNRTKSVLVGSHGVVKKAVGLGGWHWLVREIKKMTTTMKKHSRKM